MEIKTRFAPSPTGNLHIGSIRTAFYSWLFARHYNGKFILRIEDTDIKRSTNVSIQNILSGLKWLGLNWDEGPFLQTKRLNRYKDVIQMMLNQGKAYKCYCSIKDLKEIRRIQILNGEKPRYNRICRDLNPKNIIDKNYVVRFKNPVFGQVMFDDKVRGRIIFNNIELDDLIIQRSDGTPTYNFCVVIDDLDMKITHVVRGEDHINNTPRQINILKSLKASIPVYAHVSMILDEQGQKISKRNKAMNIIDYRNNGILPEALLNYIIRLGWSYGDKEIFSLKEMITLFNLKYISKSSSVINNKKLLWLNKYYINHLPLDYTSDCLRYYIKKENFNIDTGPSTKSLLNLFKNRCHTLREIAQSCNYFYKEFDYFDKIAAEKYLTFNNVPILKKLYQDIDSLSVWESKNLSKIIDKISIQSQVKMKTVNMILRVSITGNKHSPSISSVIYLIGKKITLSRLQKSIDYIQII